MVQGRGHCCVHHGEGVGDREQAHSGWPSRYVLLEPSCMLPLTPLNWTRMLVHDPGLLHGRKPGCPAVLLGLPAVIMGLLYDCSNH